MFRLGDEDVYGDLSEGPDFGLQPVPVQPERNDEGQGRKVEQRMLEALFLSTLLSTPSPNEGDQLFGFIERPPFGFRGRG